MAWIVMLMLGLLLLFSVVFRVLVTHPVSAVRYAVRDLYKYIKYHRWNECRTGKLVCFVGLFGKGKTLSAVHQVVSMYRQYNGRMVYDFSSGWTIVKQVDTFLCKIF